MNIMSRLSRPRDDDEVEVYQADAERLYESFNDLYEEFDEGRSKTPFVIIGALLAIAIVGGGLAFAYKRGGSDGADDFAVVRADRTATKVEPIDPGGLAIPHQDRQVYDQIVGAEGGAAAETDAGAEAESVLTGGLGEVPGTPPPDFELSGNDPEAFDAGPAASIDPAGTAGPDAFTIGALATRVATGETGALVPPAVGEGAAVDPFAANPAGANPAGASPAGAGPAAVGALAPSGVAEQGGVASAGSPGASNGTLEPRRVRTVTIGADGSVVEDGVEASARQLAPGVIADTELDPAAISAGGVPPASIESGVGSIETALRSGDAGLAGLGGVIGEGGSAQTSLFAPSPRPKPRPTSPAASAGTAAGQVAALEPTRPTIPLPASNSSASASLVGFAVQVASHRDQAEAVAAFADLQQRYPSLITGYQPLIQRADLGDRGVYYRLRIGPITSENEAQRLCNSLQGAGLAGCLVRPL